MNFLLLQITTTDAPQNFYKFLHISLPQLAENVIIQNWYHLLQLTVTLTEISGPNRQLNHATDMTTYFHTHRQARTYLSKGLLLLHWKYWMYPGIVLSAQAHWSEQPYDPDMHCRCSVKNLQLQTLDGVVVSSTARNLKQVLKMKQLQTSWQRILFTDS